MKNQYEYNYNFSGLGTCICAFSLFVHYFIFVVCQLEGACHIQIQVSLILLIHDATLYTLVWILEIDSPFLLGIVGPIHLDNGTQIG